MRIYSNSTNNCATTRTESAHAGHQSFIQRGHDAGVRRLVPIVVVALCAALLAGTAEAASGASMATDAVANKAIIIVRNITHPP